MYLTLFLLACAILLVTAWLLRGVIGRRSWNRRLKRAIDSLPTSRARLEQEFFTAASATGKPRGLLWTRSTFSGEPLLARDRATGDLYALVQITIAFEATLGGGMEEVEAVRNLRCATALLEWRDKQWTTAGRVMFNLEPHEAIERYDKNLEAIGPIEW